MRERRVHRTHTALLLRTPSLNWATRGKGGASNRAPRAKSSFALKVLPDESAQDKQAVLTTDLAAESRYTVGPPRICWEGKQRSLPPARGPTQQSERPLRKVRARLCRRC